MGAAVLAAAGDLVKVEKLNASIGSAVSFPVVLTADDKGIKVGKGPMA